MVRKGSAKVDRHILATNALVRFCSPLQQHMTDASSRKWWNAPGATCIYSSSGGDEFNSTEEVVIIIIKSHPTRKEEEEEIIMVVTEEKVERVQYKVP